MTLGSSLRRLREERGWSQGQLAVHSGVQQSHLSKIERDVHDTINARVLARIADALNVSTDYLMVEAGWLEPRPAIPELTFAESRFFQIIRQINSTRLQIKVLEQLTWIAEVARDAGLARQTPALKLAAEGREEHDKEE